MLYSVDRNLRPNCIRYGYGEESLDNAIRQGLRLGGNLLVDGNMEAANTSAWTAARSATLSKESGGCCDGKQVLRVAYGGLVNPSATQDVLTLGKVYRISGWARSDGSGEPYVVVSGGPEEILWQGGTSGLWKRFDVITSPIATVTLVKLYNVGGEGTYVEYDNVAAQEVVAGA